MQTRIITLSYSKVRETMLFFRKGFVEFSRAIFWKNNFSCYKQTIWPLMEIKSNTLYLRIKMETLLTLSHLPDNRTIIYCKRQSSWTLMPFCLYVKKLNNYHGHDVPSTHSNAFTRGLFLRCHICRLTWLMATRTSNLSKIAYRR